MVRLSGAARLGESNKIAAKAGLARVAIRSTVRWAVSKQLPEEKG